MRLVTIFEMLVCSVAYLTALTNPTSMFAQTQEAQVMFDALYVGKPDLDNAKYIDAQGIKRPLDQILDPLFEEANLDSEERGIFATILGVARFFQQDSKVRVQNYLQDDFLYTSQKVDLKLASLPKQHRFGTIVSNWTVDFEKRCPSTFTCQSQLNWTSGFDGSEQTVCFFDTKSGNPTLVPYLPLAGSDKEQLKEDSGVYGPYQAELYKGKVDCIQIAKENAKEIAKEVAKGHLATADRVQPRKFDPVLTETVTFKISYSDVSGKNIRFREQALLDANSRVTMTIDNGKELFDTKKLKLYRSYSYYINHHHNMVVRSSQTARSEVALLGGYVELDMQFELCDESISGTNNLISGCD